MIKKFKTFKQMNESAEQELLDSILDKIGEFGYNNLSNTEKEILDKASKEGVESLEEYVDKSDEVKITYDKLGHMLYNGVSYTEWSNRSISKIEDSDDKTKWKDTSKGSKNSYGKKPPYRVRVYKNDNSSKLYYVMVWPEIQTWMGREGDKQKYVTVANDSEKHPYGSKTIFRTKSWLGKTLEEVHKEYLDKDYDQWRDLSTDEINDFETFLKLRERYRKGEFHLITPKKGKSLDSDQIQKNNETTKFLNGLKRLYKKISNA